MSGQDVKLCPDVRGDFDLVVRDGRIDFVEGLQTTIEVSLFTDARAPDSIVLPASKRRGWIGDILRSLEDRFTGSTLWTLDQARLTSDTLSQAEIAAKDSLSWMVEDQIANEVNIVVEKLNRQINIAIEIVALDNTIERYNVLWRKTNASGLCSVRIERDLISEFYANYYGSAHYTNLENYA